jgi:DNA-binding NarL/FixJ family response regulator
VLVVDDDAELLAAQRELLELAGFEVVACVDGYDRAVDAAESDPPPDVAVVDLRLGGKSGIEVTRVLTERGIRVLIHTGAEDREALRAALQAGASGLVSKGDPIVELPDAVSRVAAGESVMARRLSDVMRPVTGQTLSPREREVLFLLATGLTNEELATQLGLSAETTRTQIRNSMRKLGARTRVEAVALAVSRGEITLP